LKFSAVIDALRRNLDRTFPERGRRRSAPLPHLPERRFNLKLGRFGAFIGCQIIPNCRFTRQLGR